MEQLTAGLQGLVDNRTHLRAINSWWPPLKEYAMDQKNFTSWQELSRSAAFPLLLSDFLFSREGSSYKYNFKFDGQLACRQPAPPILAAKFAIDYFTMEGPEQHIPAKRAVEGIVNASRVDLPTWTALELRILSEYFPYFSDIFWGCTRIFSNEHPLGGCSPRCAGNNNNCRLPIATSDHHHHHPLNVPGESRGKHFFRLKIQTSDNDDGYAPNQEKTGLHLKPPRRAAFVFVGRTAHKVRILNFHRRRFRTMTLFSPLHCGRSSSSAGRNCADATRSIETD